MTHEQIEKLMELLARAKAAWLSQELLNLTESVQSPSQAYELVLERTGKRKKALAARWYAVACRDFNSDIVGACVRFLRAVPNCQQRLRELLTTPT